MKETLVPTGTDITEGATDSHTSSRVDAFLSGTLEPFKYSAESKTNKALRLGGHAMSGLKQVANFLPLGKVADVVKAGYFLVRYGPLVLSGSEIALAFQLLVGLAQKVDAPKGSRVTSGDFFGGLYYLMGETWGERGKTPTLERLEHIDATGSVPAPQPGLLAHVRHLFRLLYVAKEKSPTDAQRLLRQVLPGAELVLAQISDKHSIPSYFLACSRADNKAFLILPGTQNPADFATDVNAEAEVFVTGSGHRGMVQSARWLHGEIGQDLLKLHSQGYQITVVGHSLGAGVGGLLTVLLRPTIVSMMCYGFGTPPCVDEALVPTLLDAMVTVVNRDDMVAHLSVHNVQRLVESVLCPGQVARTKACISQDWTAIKDVERVVQLRRREVDVPNAPGAALESPEGRIEILLAAGVERGVAERALELEDGDVSKAMLRATDEEVDSSAAGSANAGETDLAQGDTATAPELLPTDAPEPESSSLITGLRSFGAAAGGYVRSLSLRTPELPGGDENLGGDTSDSSVPSQICLGPGPTPPVVEGIQASDVEETKFFLPGEIIHLYRENGLSRAALVPFSHETLLHFTISQDMLNDHKLDSYNEALRQACIMEPTTSAWESFDERTVCVCCGSDFNWAFVLQSDPQKMLARQHCVACGRVVCDGCSQRRVAHPLLGFFTPARTCDGCFFGAPEG